MRHGGSKMTGSASPTRTKARLENALRANRAFSKLPDDALERLAAKGETLHLDVGKKLFRNASSSDEEYYYFVLEGRLNVISNMSLEPLSSEPSPDFCSTLTDYITYLSKGDCFSDAYLQKHKESQHIKIDCIAGMPTVLFRVARPVLADFLLAYPEWSKEQEHNNRLIRNHFQSQQVPTRRMVQDFFLRNNLFLASTLRVVQLDICLNCESCMKACAKRHGTARFSRNGLQLGKLLIPFGCNQCVHQACIEACSIGAITKDETTGLMHISRKCIGCGECAKACSFNGISLIEVPYSVDDFETPLPQCDALGKTNLPGLYVVGDVAGESLIKPSINAGKRSVFSIRKSSRAKSPKSDLDVVIVGAGPAGLAAALECKDLGLRYVMIEKNRFAATIRSYPAGKHIMAEPASLSNQSRLWFEDTTREDLLDKWNRIVQEDQLALVENTPVTKIIKAPDGMYQILAGEKSYQAPNVVLAIGMRGSPRKLGVEDECGPRFCYELENPVDFRGKHILVIGGGDSAVEAACSLAEVAGTTVTLSYRRDRFFRLKTKNRNRLKQLEEQGEIKVILNSKLQHVKSNQVALNSGDKNLIIKNDIIFAMVGSDPPSSFLEQTGIRVLKPGSKEMAAFAASRGTRQLSSKCDGCSAYSYRACVQACPTKALVQITPSELFFDDQGDQTNHRAHFSGMSFLEGIREHRALKHDRRAFPWYGIMIMILLAALGIESFLRHTMPERSLQAIWHTLNEIESQQIGFGSGKGLGHWFGYIGTGLMLLTLLYPLQSRLGWFRRIVARNKLLSLHIWVGFAGATLVTYHSMFSLDRWVGIACISMWLVIVSGAIGRYLYTRVHSGLGLVDWEKQSLEHKRRFAESRLNGSKWRQKIDHHPVSLLGMLWRDCFDCLWIFWMKLFGLRHIESRRERRETIKFLKDWRHNQRLRGYLKQAEKMLSHWNLIHAILTIIMFAFAIVHITYGLLYKAV